MEVLILYTILKCHINKERMEYVTTFDDGDSAGKFCNFHNCKKIDEDDPDSFYTYFYVKGFLCRNPGCLNNKNCEVTL